MLVPKPRSLCKLLSMLGLVAGLSLAATSTQAQFQDLLKLRGGKSAAKSEAEFHFELDRGNSADEAVLTISAKIPAGHYIRSMTDEGSATRLVIKRLEGMQAVDLLPQPDHEPKRERDPDLDMIVEKYLGKVTWTQRYRLLPGSTAADVVLGGQISYQICNDRQCIVAKSPVFELRLASAVEPREEEDEPVASPRTANGAAGLGALLPSKRPVPEFTATLHPAASGSDEFVLEIDAQVPPDHYIHSMGNNGGAETVIEINRLAGLEAVDDQFAADHPPETKPNDARIEGVDGQPEKIETYTGRVKWLRRFRASPASSKGPFAVDGKIFYQICSDDECRKLTAKFAAGDAAALAAHEAPQVAAAHEPATNADNPAPGAAGAGKARGRGLEKSQGLLLFLTAAVLAGFAALLTPCVFPMIPITVSFFQKQSEKQHHRPVTMATVYCLGIIGTFTGLGMLMSALFGAASLTTLANNGWLNLFIAAVLIFFAFNLLGMFEIRMPGWLLTYTANQEGRGGFAGVLFMALTFTLTSFTCTFAFAGGLLAAAANGDRLWPALGLLAFSAAFALPFFFLALFPTLMQKLPKSGGWMNVAKVVMGLVELGAAFKFLSVADLKWHPAAWIFDYELVLSAWMIISITGGMYLLGMFRLPHDMPTEHIGVVRFVSAMSFLGLAAYLAVGLYAVDKPSGKVWENILAFAPPRFSSSNESFGPAIEHGGIKYALDYQRAIEYAAKQNKPVFIDFTGVNCANCRKMEKGPLSQPEITNRLKNFVCVQVFADRVPVIADDAEAERLLAANLKLQEWFGDNSLPSYAVIPADPNIALVPAAEKLLSATVGYNPDEEEFARFLDDGLSRWKQWLAHQGGNRMVGKR